MKKRVIKGIIGASVLGLASVALVSCGGSKSVSEYIVSFNSNDPNTEDDIRPTVYNDIKVKKGDTIDLTSYQPVYEGYEFEGWYVDEELTKEFISATTINADTMLYAKWNETMKVTFNTLGGSTVNSAYVVKGKTVTKPSNPTKSSVTTSSNVVISYEFDEWCTDAALTTAYDFTTVVNAPITLYAKYNMALDAKNGTLDYSMVDFGDFEVAGPSAYASTTVGVFTTSADGNKNEIRATTGSWEKTANEATSTGTNVSISVNTLPTLYNETTKSFTKAYYLGGKSGDGTTENPYSSSQSLDVTAANDGYIVVYGRFSQGIGVVDMSNHEIVTLTDSNAVSDKTVYQYVLNVKAGSYKIYRTSGTGYIHYAEYFSITA